jgi:hypothetical protein
MNFEKQAGLPFTQISKKLLIDKTISAKAKWLYCFLFSLEETELSCEQIAEQFSDGVKSVESGISELVTSWRIKRQKKSNGKVSYTIFWDKDIEETKQPNPQKGGQATSWNKPCKAPNPQKGGQGDDPIIYYIQSNIYKDNSILNNLFLEYIQYRKKRKKEKISEETVKRIYEHLETLTKDDQEKEKIIKLTIANGWTGLFALRKESAFKKEKPSNFHKPWSCEYPDAVEIEL